MSILRETLLDLGSTNPNPVEVPEGWVHKVQFKLVKPAHVGHSIEHIKQVIAMRIKAREIAGDEWVEVYDNNSSYWTSTFWFARKEHALLTRLSANG